MTELENQEAEKQKLAELLSAVKTQIEESKKSLEQVKSVVAEIDNYHKAFIKIREKLDNEDDGLETNLEWSQKKKQEIDTLKKTSEENLKNITDALASVKANIEQMETAHKDFVATKIKIDDGESGLLVVLQKSQSLKDEIASLKKTAEENLSQIKATLASIQEHTREMETAYVNFTAVKGKIDDKETGLLAILASSTKTQQQINAVKKQSDGLFEEIKKFRDEAQKNNNDITNLKLEAQASTEVIKGYELDSQDYKTKIAKIYKLATDSGLANSFDLRKNELKDSERKWFWTLLGSTAVLALIVLWIYNTSINGGSVEISNTFWYKLTFTSPVIFLVVFATERYATERNLLERYAFKATTAFALESYTTLLKNTFKKDDHENRILDFVLSSMNTIYKEPFEQKKETKWNLGLHSKLGALKAEHANSSEENIITPLVTTKTETTVKTQPEKVVESAPEK